MSYQQAMMKEKKQYSNAVIKKVIYLLLIVMIGGLIYQNLNVMDNKMFSASHHIGVGKEDWNLILVNDKYNLPTDYEVSLMKLKDGSLIDERIYQDLQAMFDEARLNGLFPVINSAYRTAQEQKELYDEKIKQYIMQGYSLKESKTLASGWVANPKHSEHETGLALDIIGQNGTSEFVQQWLSENSYKYGFILRYPSGKEHITGINYEPWHFRYVGVEVANDMFRSGVTLEEYLGLS